MRVAVAGGTGVVGAHVVDVLRERGDDPVVLSRSAGVDVLAGTGLGAAVDGADAVIDVLNVTTNRRAVAERFFTRATGNLVATGLPLVLLSIVGVDRTPLGYYRAKLAQEQVALAGGRATVLRATQFHEFPQQVVARGLGPLVPVPRMRSQPISAREVAEHLVSWVGEAPAGLVPDLAGPRVEDVVGLVRRVAGRRVVVPITMPGATGRAMTTDGLLPQADGPRGTVTFDDWLASR